MPPLAALQRLADSGQVIISAQSHGASSLSLWGRCVARPPAHRLPRPADRDTLILDYHAAVAEAGLPLILFYLYEEAGGISYSPDLLRKLLAMPEVLGIKVATLDSVMTFQDLAQPDRRRDAPDKVLITGEDRFLGYSLMCGAQAALVGMGAACTELQAELLAGPLRRAGPIASSSGAVPSTTWPARRSGPPWKATSSACSGVSFTRVSCPSRPPAIPMVPGSIPPNSPPSASAWRGSGRSSRAIAETHP